MLKSNPNRQFVKLTLTSNAGAWPCAAIRRAPSGKVRVRVRDRDWVTIRLRVGGGVVGSVLVATPGSAHSTSIELQVLIIPQHEA